MIADEDVAELRVAYFNNDIKDYLSQGVNPKLEDWSSPYVITKNYDRFKLSGYEVELKYNSNYAFGSVDATFYNNAELCSRDEMALGVYHLLVIRLVLHGGYHLHVFHPRKLSPELLG